MNDALASLVEDLELDEEDTRAPRETREMNVRKSEPNIVWSPASNLPDPDQRDGWKHRWVRIAHGGHPDSTNMAKAMREGWSPAPASDYPELTPLLFDRSGNKDIIEFGGLVLCRMPEELAAARDRHFTNQAKKQVSAVNARLREGVGDDRLRFESELNTQVKRTLRE